MNEKDLRPSGQFAQMLGCKIVLYGKPGSGKTPLAATTSPRPLLLLSEPGALTLRGTNIPTFDAFTVERINEFFTWFFSGSKEVDNYDTLIWDSATQGAEIYLDKALRKGSASGNKAHGQAAYGDMAFTMNDHLSKLYFMQRKHVILICKRAVIEDMGVPMARPIFPGNDLNTKVPHLYDGMFQLGRYPATGVQTPLLQCQESLDAMARDRSGMLAMYEHPNFTNVFGKMMSAPAPQAG